MNATHKLVGTAKAIGNKNHLSVPKKQNEGREQFPALRLLCLVLAYRCVIFAGSTLSIIYYLCKFLFKNENYPKSRR